MPQADLGEQFVAYRQMRGAIEEGVLPLATSVDGRSFVFQLSLHHLAVRRGGYVVVEADGVRRLGMVTQVRVDSQTATASGPDGAPSEVVLRLARGNGILLDGTDPFHDAMLRLATPGEVAAWSSRTRPRRAPLNVGELLLAPGVPATLDSGALGRHTFMCGQSGSGKTYSLGVLLERVLAETSLPVVILDPNSDYVHLGRIRDGADPALATAYKNVPDQVAVWTNDPSAEHVLRLRFADLSVAAQAALLGLDPIRDREEYALLTDLLLAREDGRPLVADVDQLLAMQKPGARELGLRANNLGVLRWDVWGPEMPSIVEELQQPTKRCIVVDTGSLATVHEQRLVTESVLSTLWHNRHLRRPTLVVIDEAHNVCSSHPEDALAELSAEHVVRIAAEGRKYGLYLLIATQRPHKVKEDILSQCDNLLLMRTSPADLADLGRILSFVPPGLVDAASSFGMGAALVAGRFLPHPTLVRMGDRVSEEGGGDVPATWAEPLRTI